MRKGEEKGGKKDNREKGKGKGNKIGEEKAKGKGKGRKRFRCGRIGHMQRERYAKPPDNGEKKEKGVKERTEKETTTVERNATHFQRQSVCEENGIGFFWVIDAGFNGGALCSKRWLQQHIRYLQSQGKEVLAYIERRGAEPPVFVFLAPESAENRPKLPSAQCGAATTFEKRTVGSYREIRSCS